jgi:exodeoxyribonuclease VII large subunit
MAVRANKPGPTEEALTRQLGLGLLFETRPAQPLPVPAAVLPAVAPLPMPAPLPANGSPPPVLGAESANELVPAAPVGGGEAPRVPRIFKVGELVRAARLTLESRFGEVRVDGEVSGLKRSGPGHLYFCLKDDLGSLDCVMYSREASRLKFQVEDGMAVRLRGRLTIYEGRGRFQMSVVEIEPQGAGALAIAFEQLKKKLEAAGLFAAARKRPLPFVPRRVGVVTSPQGAVIRDIVRVAHRRFPVAILLAPTPVQGPGAAQGIVAALERLARVDDVDVIIVARGGGSIEDLWSFNTEEVALAIAACRVPVISAVGHETDFTIADFVADLRASTPSAAAERVVPVLADLRAEILLHMQRAARGTGARLKVAHLALERARGRLGDPRRLVDERRQTLDELGARAHRMLGRCVARRRAALGAVEVALSRAHPHRRIAAQRAALVELTQRLEANARRAFQRRHAAMETLEHKLSALSPRRVLERGYSLAFGPDGHLLSDAAAVEPGQRIRVALRRGEVGAVVDQVGDQQGENVRAEPAPKGSGSSS